MQVPQTSGALCRSGEAQLRPLKYDTPYVAAQPSLTVAVRDCNVKNTWSIDPHIWAVMNQESTNKRRRALYVLES